MTEGKPIPPYPGPAPAGNRPVLVAVLAALVFLVVAGGGYIGVSRSGLLDEATSAGPGPASPAQVPGASGNGPTGSAPVPTVPPTAPPTGPPKQTLPAGTPDQVALLPDGTAEQLLGEQAVIDEAQVRALSGQWVPQVSSKCVGIPVDIQPDWRPDGSRETASVTAAQIAAFHLALYQRHGALTVRPVTLGIDENLGTQGLCEGLLLWISIVPEGYSNPADANYWCDSYGIPEDDCYARRVAPGGKSDYVLRSET